VTKAKGQLLQVGLALMLFILVQPSVVQFRKFGCQPCHISTWIITFFFFFFFFFFFLCYLDNYVYRDLVQTKLFVPFNGRKMLVLL
jgi:hypothetical protein